METHDFPSIRKVGAKSTGDVIGMSKPENAICGIEHIHVGPKSALFLEENRGLVSGKGRRRLFGQRNGRLAVVEHWLEDLAEFGAVKKQLDSRPVNAEDFAAIRLLEGVLNRHVTRNPAGNCAGDLVESTTTGFVLLRIHIPGDLVKLGNAEMDIARDPRWIL